MYDASGITLTEPPNWVLELLASTSDALPVDPLAGLAGQLAETFLPVPDCPCCTEPDAAAPACWDLPGMAPPATGPSRPSPSPLIARLQELVTDIVRIDPVALPGPQALVDSEGLLSVVHGLRVHNLGRLADVHSRQLHELVEIGATSTWVKRTSPDTDGGDLPLARKLRELPFVRARLDTKVLGIAVARRVVAELSALRRHLDRPDGLIDGQPSSEVLPAVVRHVVTKVAESNLGLGEDSPLLAAVSRQAETILAEGGADLVQLERAFVLLAEHVPATHLKDCLEELSGALLPNLLEEKAERGHDHAGLALQRKPDGAGWTLKGELDLETGELLFQALAAEARRDGENPEDTVNAEALRQQGLDPYDPDGPFDPTTTGTFTLPRSEVPLRWPRRKARRLHDALKLLLERYLAADLAGSHDKQPVRLSVTVASSLLDGEPGAPPAVAGSGARLPRSLIRQWWCNAAVTRFLMSRGWIPLGVAHTQRTLTATERTALDLQSGGHRCAGLGCCPGMPDPTTTLEPHHVEPWAETGTTSLAMSIWACPTLHHDLHHGKTVLLRSGRRLNATGWVA